uniref:Uncharacterized protein n=1 Tax=viral metagenome TaxID=1070528 RepID=A0A6C0BBZ1_9ZZZZ
MSYPKGRPWPALTTFMVAGLKIKEAQRASLILSATGNQVIP